MMLSMLQNQAVEFTWKTIKCWEIDESNGLFSFQFQREEKSPKCVKLHTPYVSHFYNINDHFFFFFFTGLET